MKKLLFPFLVGIILLIGLGLRLYNLTDNPHGFFCDEADIAYNAYMLLHHGTDEYGKIFPVFFESFGDYKDPVEVYSTIPFVAIFGLTEFASRFPAVVWGVLTILAVYLLTFEIRNSRIAAIAAATVAATMPWLVHYSRMGVEFSVYIATWTWTLYFFLKAFKRKVFFIPAFIALGITFYAYQPAKLLVPLLLLGWALTYHHMLWRHRKTVGIGLFIFIIIAMPMIVSFFGAAGIARFAMVSIFSAHLPFDQMVTRMVGNYFYQLSPEFFLKGEPTFITRHFVGGLLPLLPVTVPFLAIGIFYCLFRIKRASSQLLLWLLLIYPIAGAVVADAPFTSRGAIGAPLFAILTGIGIELAIRLGRHWIGKVAVGIAIVALLLGNTILFAQFYFYKYPMYSSDFWGWQYGAAPVMKYFIAHTHDYDDLALTGAFNAPEAFLKFYAPEGQCPNCKIALPHDIYDNKRKQLFAMTPDDIARNPEYSYKTVGAIYYPNNAEAFRLVMLHKN